MKKTTPLWINAGKLLADDPTSQVLCPECQAHNLCVKNIQSPDDLKIIELKLSCVSCGSYNYLRMIRPVHSHIHPYNPSPVKQIGKKEKETKSLTEIWDEYETNGCITQKTKNDFAWHIKNDDPPDNAITWATDMGLKELGSVIAEHLTHHDDYTRELTVGCLLGRLKLPEYAAIGLKMAKEDPSSGVVSLALSSIGNVLPLVSDKKISQQIATYLQDIFLNKKQDKVSRRYAYGSILDALEIPFPKRLDMVNGLRLPDQAEWTLIDQFKTRYVLDNSPKDKRYADR